MKTQLYNENGDPFIQHKTDEYADPVKKSSRCIRRAFNTKSQAEIVAIRVGQRDGVRMYPDYCNICKAYHISAGK